MGATSSSRNRSSRPQAPRASSPPSVPAGLRCLLAWLLLASLAGGASVPQVTLGLVVPPSEPDATSLLRGVQLAVADANERSVAQLGGAEKRRNILRRGHDATAAEGIVL